MQKYFCMIILHLKKAHLVRYQISEDESGEISECTSTQFYIRF